MQHGNLVAWATSVACALAITTGSLEAQTLHRHSISSDATFSASPGTHGTDVYRQPVANNFCCNCEDVELIDDLHLTAAGNLVSFDFTYTTLSVSSAATSATAYVNFYDNDPADSLDPTTGTATSLGSVVLPNLPIGGFAQFIHTETVDLVTPIALPADIWMGVRIDLEGVDPPIVGGICSPSDWASVMFDITGAPPSLGGNHDLFGAGPPFNGIFSMNWRSSVTLRTGSAPPANHAPACFVALADAQASFLETSPGVFVVTEGETITVPFIGVDQDGDNLTVSSNTLPAGATLSPASGATPLVSTFQWTPTAANKAGTPYTLFVTFDDGQGGTATCQVGVADINLKPVCSASNQTLECTSSSGALVTLDGAATDADDATVMYHWDVSDTSVNLDDENIAMPSGTFPVGVTMATLTVTDGRGGVSTCDVLITVEDTVPPDVMCTTDVAALWPPNHGMRSVSLIVTATDTCAEPGAVLPITVTVSSDEPDNAQADGNTTGDVNGADGFGSGVDVTSVFAYDPGTQEWRGTIELRAERRGNGSGRKYTIDVTALDAADNPAMTSCCIVVPHDRRGAN